MASSRTTVQHWDANVQEHTEVNVFWKEMPVLNNRKQKTKVILTAFQGTA